MSTPARTSSETVEWLVEAIRSLPSDPLVERGTPGYNVYTSQKDHWLGWLNPAQGTGTYPRKSGNSKGARGVYNQIGEPKMLVWLARAADVPSHLLEAAVLEAAQAKSMRGEAAAIRKHVPWEVIAQALSWHKKKH